MHLYLNSMDLIQLKGITWDHSRGFTSIAAISQRFSELNPGVEISWDKRSLQAFADEPVNELADRYDFLIMDHPWTGYAAANGVILPLNDFLPDEFMHDLASNTVGRSHESYGVRGKQWALAIDAATPVAASRPDLFRKEGTGLPETWDDLVGLSRTGRVAIPGIPQDSLMNFYMICSTLGDDVCTSTEHVVSPQTGIKALELLRELGRNIRPECYDWNPIRVYEAMSSGDEFLYCPFAYGYSNYSKKGYAENKLKFHDMVALGDQKLITTLGGTGLAVSAGCRNRDAAMKFVEYAGKADTQKGLFFDCGGQPGHRQAWLDEHTNSQSMDFFRDTLPALDRAFLRPRYDGHMYFQDRAGAPVREYMMKGGNAEEVLDHLNNLYAESLKK